MTPEERQILNETRTNMYDIKDRLDDIVNILKGDNMGHSKGLIPMLKEHEDRIKNLEKIKDRTVWTIAGLSAMSGYGVLEFIKKFFNHS